MKPYHNILHSPESRYTGYSADGRSWSIQQLNGGWTALANETLQGSTNLLVGFDTLTKLSAELEEIGKPTPQWRYREDTGYAPYTWRTTSPEDEDLVGDIEYRTTPNRL